MLAIADYIENRYLTQLLAQTLLVFKARFDENLQSPRKRGFFWWFSLSVADKITNVGPLNRINAGRCDYEFGSIQLTNPPVGSFKIYSP